MQLFALKNNRKLNDKKNYALNVAGHYAMNQCKIWKGNVHHLRVIFNNIVRLINSVFSDLFRCD